MSEWVKVFAKYHHMNANHSWVDSVVCNSISSCLHLTASSLSSTLEKRRSLKHFVYLKYVLQNECLSAIILLTTKNLFLSNFLRTRTKKFLLFVSILHSHNYLLCLIIIQIFVWALFFSLLLFFLVMRFCCYKNFSSFMPWRISLCPEHSGLV